VRYVALTGRGTARCSRSLESIQGTDLARAGAALWNVTRTGGRTARRRRRRENGVAVAGILIAHVRCALVGSGAAGVARHPAVAAHITFVDRAVAVVVDHVANFGCRDTDEADIEPTAVALRPCSRIGAELVDTYDANVVLS